MGAPLVNILLSTYNGEKYLRCQLDSLLAQDYPNFAIHVRDDGSTDGTLAVLRSYAAASPRVHILDDPDDGTAPNLGYARSFIRLLAESGGADYYAFCDQDDAWEPDKVSRGVAALAARGGGLPRLYTSSYWFCDENLEKISAPPPPPQSLPFRRTLFYSTAIGFTMLLNRPLRDKVVAIGAEGGIPHDTLCEKVAALLGECVCDSAKTARYRRHRKTVTYTGAGRLRLIAKWLRGDVFGSVMKDYRRYVTRVYEAIGDDPSIRSEDRRCLELFRERRQTPAVYFGRLLYPHRLRPSLGGELALRLCFLLAR